MKINEAVDIYEFWGKPDTYMHFNDKPIMKVPDWGVEMMNIEIMGLSGIPLFAVGGVLGRIVAKELAPIVKNTMLGVKYPEFKELLREAKTIANKRGLGESEEQYKKKLKKLLNDITKFSKKVEQDDSIPNTDKAKLFSGVGRLFEALKYSQKTNNMATSIERRFG